MDPVTAALNFATASLTLATKIWDATPPVMQQAEAENWAKFITGLGSFVVGLQAGILAKLPKP